MRRVLLVTHETSRTGAPRVAQQVAGALVADGDEVTVVARSPGPLLGEFAQLCPTRVEPLSRLRRRLWRAFPERLARAVDLALAGLTVLASRADLVYVNSTAAIVYARAAAALGRPVVVHVHESGAIAERFRARAGADFRDDRITWVACSPSVRVDLAAARGGDPAGITMLPSVPDRERVETSAADEPDRDYRPDTLVVGCCGSVEQRKGFDLWQAAVELVPHRVGDREVQFVWVGENLAGAGSADPSVAFHGATSNPYAHMRRFDVATLPSRDDPFPLVVLESMLLGVPVVAFGVGGVAVQVGRGGIVVPPGDVAGFAEAVTLLLTDDAMRAQMGRRARARARDEFGSAAFCRGVRAVVRGAEDPGHVIPV